MEEKKNIIHERKERKVVTIFVMLGGLCLLSGIVYLVLPSYNSIYFKNNATQEEGSSSGGGGSNPATYCGVAAGEYKYEDSTWVRGTVFCQGSKSVRIGGTYNDPIYTPVFPPSGDTWRVESWTCARASGLQWQNCQARRSAQCQEPSGKDFSNTTVCSNDNLSISNTTASTIVESCTDAKKCEYTCNSGYHVEAGKCVGSGNVNTNSGKSNSNVNGNNNTNSGNGNNNINVNKNKNTNTNSSLSTHTICSNMQCKTVTGAGVDACSTNDDCKHSVCQGMQCIEVSGPGSDLCSTNTDCTHSACQRMQCIEVAGAGSDLCSTDNVDNDCKHSVCQNMQCTSVEGEGTDICITSDDCEEQLERIYIITNPFNNLAVQYQISGNTIIFTTTGTASKTWSLRGTAGGKLDTYSGNRLVYTPSGIKGEEVLTVSDGQSKAYAQIDVQYTGNNAMFTITHTNLHQTGGTFPINVSIGTDVKESIQFKALGEYKVPESGALLYKDITSDVEWNTSDESFGKISDYGLFTAEKSGTTSLSVKKDDFTSNTIKVYINPTFVTVSEQDTHFEPYTVAKGYTTKLWAFVESDTSAEDIIVASADLSRLNIAPFCTNNENENENVNADCHSSWTMQEGGTEGNGKWVFIEFRVPFTVQDGVFNVTIRATSSNNKIDRHFSIPLRVVGEVMKGDINGDGVLSVQDAILALQVSVGKIEERHRNVNVTADVNGDGHIGLPEAIFVLNSLAK